MTQPTEDGQTLPEQVFKCPVCGKIVEEPTLCEECLDKKNRREKVAIEGILSMVAENKSNGVLTADQKRHPKALIELFTADKMDLKDFLSECEKGGLITSLHLDGTMLEDVCKGKYYSDLESLGILFPIELRF